MIDLTKLTEEEKKALHKKMVAEMKQKINEKGLTEEEMLKDFENFEKEYRKFWTLEYFGKKE